MTPSGAEAARWGLVLIIPALITGTCAMLIPKGGVWTVLGAVTLTILIILERMLSGLYHRAISAEDASPYMTGDGYTMMQDINDIRAHGHGIPSGDDDGDDDGNTKP